MKKLNKNIIYTNQPKGFNLDVSTTTISRILLTKPKVPFLVLGLCRNYSTTVTIGPAKPKVTPEVVYSNADTQKELIFKDAKGKSGVYRWINNLNGNTYIGSAIDLQKRFYHYYSLRLMELYLQKKTSLIYNALIKLFELQLRNSWILWTF